MTTTHRHGALLIALLLYAAASLTHFAHNAVFADAYPNLPASLTPMRIMGVWLLEAMLGIAGYVLVRKSFRRVGLILIAVYAALGFDGFAHYLLAPASAHTMAMNATIWAEAIAGALLLVAVAYTWRRPGMTIATMPARDG